MPYSSVDQKSTSKRQGSIDDDGISSIQIKRHDSEKSTDGLEFKCISSFELLKLLKLHLSTALPDCAIMFPWLHGYSTSPPPIYPNCISIVRSQPMSEGWIQNSGILRCSIDPHEFLMTWTNENNHCYADNKKSASIVRKIIAQELTKLNFHLSEEDTDDIANLCLQYNVLPFLTTDSYARETYGLKKNWKVGNSYNHASSTATPNLKQPGSFRRFDIQPAKMLEMSSKIILYCFGAEGYHNYTKTHCGRCYQLAKLLKIALKFLQRNYLTREKHDYEIHILKYASFEDIPKELIGTIPMATKTLNKLSPRQLVSQFDVISFNNWDRDLLYREKLEMSKMSSASSVEETSTLWCGNSTDYQVYKLLATQKHFNDEIKKHPPYYSIDNSIVRLTNLHYDANCPTSIDPMLFNIPSTKKPWVLMIRCMEGVSPPPIDKLWECLEGTVRHISPKPTELSFPSSGTITLGSLNINSIKMILNTCYIIYQISNIAECGTLIYCSDGYTETTFLLVAYLIFLWDLPLEETLIKLHLEYERPFFLFHVDLQVLGHLQTLLRKFSPKRIENSRYYSNDTSTKVEPLEITPEMFSKIFLFKIPPESDFSNLKGPLPSRILPHLYLGSLEHAQSPALLKKLGINYIVSVGEDLSWTGTINSRHRAASSPSPPFTKSASITRNRGITMAVHKRDEVDDMDCCIDIFELEEFKILRIMNLGDNGKDTLTSQLEHILAFIEDCYQNNGKVLVHCMVGVSRSATVCIAECMKRLQCDVLRAYLFVRVRRLNIIIQPNLMFMYELLKWQEFQGEKRTTDWHIICRSISELNNNYI